MKAPKEQYYTVKEVSEMLGISIRAVKHYREVFSDFVLKETDGKVFLSETFIRKVKKARAENIRTISEPRTKAELVEEIHRLEKENAILKKELAEYENSEVFEKADAGMRVEVFTEAEYKIFEETLIHYKVQAKEIEMQEVRFDSLKDERDYLRSQYEYALKSKDRILQMHESLIEAIKERNYIEAVEKGATPKQPKDIKNYE